MELVISDSVFDGDRDGLNLREVRGREPCSTGASHDIVGRVLVGVSGLQASGMDDLHDGVDAETRVRVYGRAFPFDKPAREIGGVDATGEQLVLVVVYVLGVFDCVRSVKNYAS